VLGVALLGALKGRGDGGQAPGWVRLEVEVPARYQWVVDIIDFE
jgi:hypothetical protein